jgi:hypothetical protein
MLAPMPHKFIRTTNHFNFNFTTSIQKMVSRHTTANQRPRRVSFKQDDVLVSVHYIPPLDSLPLQDLFYNSEDFERFRFDRNLEMERNIRKQLQSDGFRRATRRSSIDLMMLPTGASSYGSMPYHPKQAATVPRPTIRGGRAAAKGLGVALAA